MDYMDLAILLSANHSQGGSKTKDDSGENNKCEVVTPIAYTNYSRYIPLASFQQSNASQETYWGIQTMSANNFYIIVHGTQNFNINWLTVGY